MGIPPYKFYRGLPCNCYLLIVNCSFPRGRAGAHTTERNACPFFIFIVIVEKKITLSVIFFSTVTVIVTVIGMHCITLYHGKVKVGKSEGNCGR